MFQLDLPWFLLLLPLPFFVYRFVPRSKKQETALRVPFYHMLASIQQRHVQSGEREGWERITFSAVWVLLVLAGSQPQWVGEPVPLPTTGRDLMLAVDLSGSMQETDMEYRGQLVQRIQIVKKVVSDFVEKRETDRLGLILFGSKAYLQAPLTFDRGTVNELLIESQLGFAGNQTAIGDAIGLAIKRLRDRPAASRVVILLTDGQNTAGEVDPAQAADLAKLADVKIYTIGVASDKVLRKGFGFFSQQTRADADLDENTLQYIAKTTGGQYFRARDASELAAIYDELNKIEPIEQSDEVFRPIRVLYYWPLSFAFILSAILGLARIQWQQLAQRSSTQPSGEQA